MCYFLLNVYGNYYYVKKNIHFLPGKGDVVGKNTLVQVDKQEGKDSSGSTACHGAGWIPAEGHTRGGQNWNHLSLGTVATAGKENRKPGTRFPVCAAVPWPVLPAAGRRLRWLLEDEVVTAVL